MIVFLLISLVIIIVMHELAHLITAHLCGCKILRISLGFGKPVLFKKKIRGVVCQVTPWILGGYVQMKGECTYSQDKDAFVNLPYWKRAIIIVAGCAINIKMGITAWVLGILLNNFYLITFGVLSIAMGVSNLLPIPALDGSYLIFPPIFVKKWGMKEGYRRLSKVNGISFMILVIMNILSVIAAVIFYFLYLR